MVAARSQRPHRACVMSVGGGRLDPVVRQEVPRIPLSQDAHAQAEAILYFFFQDGREWGERDVEQLMGMIAEQSVVVVMIHKPEIEGAMRKFAQLLSQRFSLVVYVVRPGSKEPVQALPEEVHHDEAA